MKFKFILTTVLFISNMAICKNNDNLKKDLYNFHELLFENLESNFIYRANVDWKKIQNAYFKDVDKAMDFKDSLNSVPMLFDAIGCNHCQLFSEHGHFISSLNPSLGQDDFNLEFLIEYEKKPEFQVKLIDDQFGYINIPGMLLIDVSQDELNLKAQKMYNQIVNLAKRHNIKGWIIDLRFNIGGNVYPMLASLHYLLGDNVVYKTLDKDKNLITVHKLKDGKFYSGDKLETIVKTSIKPDLNIPVAVIVGKLTSSAGENVAIAFKNRQYSKIIGDSTYGFLTGNELIDLNETTKLAVTTSYIADSNDIYTENIQPDIFVDKKDNFKNLIFDGNIIEAINFFNVFK